MALSSPMAERLPDPGSPWAARFAGVLAVVFLAIVVYIQQSALHEPEPAPAQAAVVPPPDLPLEIAAKITVKIHHWMQSAQPSGGADPMGPQLARSLEPYPKNPADFVRGAIAAAAIGGTESAESMLAKAEKDLPDDSVLHTDISAVRAILADEPPDEETTAGLIERHGWFGRLAGVSDKPDTDPVRARMLAGGGAIIGLGLLAAFIVIAAILAGCVLFIIGIVRAKSGTLRARFEPPVPGGSLGIELAAAFVGSFILLKLGAVLLALFVSESTVQVVTLGAQWALLVLVLCYPAIRGFRAGESLRLLGVHRGAGVAREIGCGILGYLATLPIVAIAIVLTVVLMFVRTLVTGPDTPAPQNPVIETLAGADSALFIIMFVLLATVWAPIVEETVFRGGLYRQLRGRLPWVLAAIVTALFFGLMHGYPVLMLAPVMSLGFGFAMIREWRGSLIAPMTAHFLHNASVTTILLTALSLIGD